MMYVEVFGGGGSVLLNKERSVREVLNDANGNLINLYRVVREHPDELKDRLLYVMHSREDFKIAQRRLAQFSYKDDILRAADFYQVVRQSYAGNGKQFSAVARSMWAGFPAIDRVAGRLQGVTLEKEDFGVIFQRYDSPTTVFYIDPPYFFTEDYYPGNIFLRSDHQRLATILLNVEGQWLPFLTIFARKCWSCTSSPESSSSRWTASTTWPSGTRAGPSTKEVLISNYDTRKSAQSHCISLSLRRRKGKYYGTDCIKNIGKEGQDYHPRGPSGRNWISVRVTCCCLRPTHLTGWSSLD